jgi:hypothetical protein
MVDGAEELRTDLLVTFSSAIPTSFFAYDFAEGLAGGLTRLQFAIDPT